MKLRRPTLADKEAILSMMAEFEETQSLMTEAFGMLKLLFTKPGWKVIVTWKWG